jgi:hypothetical protein
VICTRRATQSVALAIAIVSVAGAIGCDRSTTAPTPASPVISAISAAASSVAAGGTMPATVRLTASASGAGSTVTLSSSNSAALTVPPSVVIPAGSSSATFTVTAVAAGAATVRASLDNSSQSLALVVTGQPATLSAIRVSASSVVGGSALTGTVVLSGAAPAGGALVRLSSADPVDVPDNVTVPAGASSADFAIRTRQVVAATTGTVDGSFGGVAASVAFAITVPTTATASFGVVGDSETETCSLTNGGNTLACTFDGSTSTAPGAIVAWDWSYGVAGIFSQTTPGPVLAMPAVNCSIVPAPPFPAGTAAFPLIVTLTIRDALGNVSALSIHQSRVLPQGVCGF